MTHDAERTAPVGRASRRRAETTSPTMAAESATHAQPPDEKVDVEAIKRAYPLLDVLERYGIVTRGTGVRRTALCPFHDDHEPSLTVYVDSDRFHCFGCGVAGDVIDFVEHLEGVGFREAVRLLDTGGRAMSGARLQTPSRTQSVAQQSAAALPRPSGRSTPQPRAAQEHDAGRHMQDTIPVPAPDLPSASFPFGPPWHPFHLRLAMLTAAAAISRETLLRTPHANAYLDARGIPTAVAQAAYLGYADGVSLIRYLSQAPALLSSARSCGLIDARGRETLRGRLIIPEIRGGLCIWLHGRMLPETAPAARGRAGSAGALPQAPTGTRAPKYLGCSLTKPLLGAGLSDHFGDSRHHAPGLYRGTLLRGIIVVEGAFDLLTLLSWQVPIRCVALIGTHASAEQLAHLVALAAPGPIWLALDADAPGEAAVTHLNDQLARYPYGVERLAPPLGSKDFTEVATIPEARQTVLQTLRVGLVNLAHIAHHDAASEDAIVSAPHDGIQTRQQLGRSMPQSVSETRI